MKRFSRREPAVDRLYRATRCFWFIFLVFDFGIHILPLSGLAVDSTPYSALHFQKEINKFPKNTNHWIVRFHDRLSPQEREQFIDHGIRFLTYLQAATYLVQTETETLENLLERDDVLGATPVPDSLKVDPELVFDINAQAALQSVQDTTVKVDVLFYPGTAFESAREILLAHQAVLEATHTYFDFRTLLERVEIPKTEVTALAQEDSVCIIQKADWSYVTHNQIAQDTSNIDEIHPGSPFGFDLDGTGVVVGVWEAGQARESHEQIRGRVENIEQSLGLNSHSSHIVGTIAGNGAGNPAAQGMAPNAGVKIWDFKGDLRELDYNANCIMISNHSYESDEFVPYRQWGFDLIAFDHDHCIIFSAGNRRSRSEKISRFINPSELEIPDGYSSLSSTSMSKNTLVVGAIKDIPEDPPILSSDHMTDFSGWGPTRNGLLKPDVVANGHHLLSLGSEADDSYFEMSGTSMAAAVVTGAVACLTQQYRERFHDAIPPSSFMRGLIIHTARDDLTFPGPDYRFGWGLLDARTAAEFIKEHSMNSKQWFDLSDFRQEEKRYVTRSEGTEPIKVTLAWNDPAGLPMNDTEMGRLINDLDLLIEGPDGYHYPWTLDYTHPEELATRGVNDIDNVEQVYIAAPMPGEYTIRVRGWLNQGNRQPYALCVSGLERQQDRPVVMLMNRFGSGNLQGEIPLAFYAASVAGISRIAVSIDEKIIDLPHTSRLDGDFIYSSHASEVIESVTLDTTLLTKGEHTLAIIVLDANGETAEVRRTFQVFNYDRSRELIADGPMRTERLDIISNEVIYAFQPTRSATYTIETHPYSNEVEGDTILQLYETEIPGVLIAEDDDSGLRTFSRITSYLYAGNTYAVRVKGYKDSMGVFSVDVKTVTKSIDTPITALEVNAEPIHVAFLDVGDVHWYSFRSEKLDTYMVQANSSSNSTRTSFTFMLFQASNKNLPIAHGYFTKPIVMNLEGGQDYLLKVICPKNLVSYKIGVKAILHSEETLLQINDENPQVHSIEEGHDQWFVFKTNSFGEYIISVTNAYESAQSVLSFNIREITKPNVVLERSNTDSEIHIYVKPDITFAVQIISDFHADYRITVRTDSVSPLQELNPYEPWTEIQFTRGKREERWFYYRSFQDSFYQFITLPHHPEVYGRSFITRIRSGINHATLPFAEDDFWNDPLGRYLFYMYMSESRYLRVTSETGKGTMSFRLINVPSQEWPTRIEHHIEAPDGFIAGKPIIVDATLFQDFKDINVINSQVHIIVPTAWTATVLDVNTIRAPERGLIFFDVSLPEKIYPFRYQLIPNIEAQGSYMIRYEYGLSGFMDSYTNEPYSRRFKPDSIENLEIQPATLVEDWMLASPP